MSGKEVRINSIWYNLFSLPLDLVEWLGFASLLASPFLVYYGKMPIIFLIIGFPVIGFGTFVSFWSKKYLLEGRCLVEYQFGGGHEEVSKIIADGPYQYTRHPWYIANITEAFGASIIWFSLLPSWILILGPLALLVVIMRVKVEEAWLFREFPEYREYKNNVGFLSPSKG